MAKPYQDLQGNWFVAGRPMTQQEVAMNPGTQPVIPQPVPQAAPLAPAQQPITMAPKATPKPVKADPLEVAMQNAKNKKKFGLNPIGSAFSSLFGK